MTPPPAEPVAAMIRPVPVRVDSKVTDIDCRPSDAIALALRAKVPIYVADRVLEEAQVDWQDD